MSDSLDMPILALEGRRKMTGNNEIHIEISTAFSNSEWTKIISLTSVCWYAGVDVA
jgi:hypothetical protein